jgi:hypothetical protein
MGKTSLWKDRWINETPFCLRYPILFQLCQNKDIIVHNFILRQGRLNFSRWLPAWLFEQWLEMVNLIYNCQFENINDSMIWKWSNKCKFTTKTVYV